MPARILVVDDVFANVRWLESRLAAGGFEVICALDGPDALAICQRGLCDLVLVDTTMPEMDGFEVCRRLKQVPATTHVPVIMLSVLDQPRERLRGLDAGADDFLTRPVDDLALLARVRSLAGLKSAVDALRRHASAVGEPGGAGGSAAVAETGHHAQILLVEDRPASCERLAAALGRYHRVEVEADPHQALIRAAERAVDLVLVSLGLKARDGVRLCGELRSLDRTRQVAVLMIAEAEDRARIERGLDIGADDFLMRPVDRNELIARVSAQVRRVRFAERLRDGIGPRPEPAVPNPPGDRGATLGARDRPPGRRHRARL